MTTTERLNEVRAQLDELTTEAQALLDSTDGEDLDGEALDRWNEIQAELDPLREREAKLEKMQAQIASTMTIRARMQGTGEPSQARGTSLAIATIPNVQPREVSNFRREGMDYETAAKNAYRAGMWMIDMLSGGRNQKAREYCESQGIIRAAQTEGTQQEGGALVPTELGNAVIDVRERVAVLRRLTRVEPMMSDTKDVPKRLTGLTVVYPGEAKTIAESQKQWGRVKLSVVKRSVFTKISSELEEDAIINVVNDIAGEMGQAFGETEDNEIVNGDGSAAFGGEHGLIRKLAAGGQVTMPSGSSSFEQVTRQLLLDVLAKLPEKFHPNASWLLSRSAFNQAIHGLGLAQGGSPGLEFTQGLSTAGFLGYPLEFTDAMPITSAANTYLALFGNWREAMMIGDRRQIRIGVSDQFAFDEDVTSVRGTTRYDINVHEFGTATKAGAYVGIKTAAS